MAKNSCAKTARAQASAVASFVTHYPLVRLIPSPRAIATLSPQTQTLAIVRGLIRKQTVEFLLAGMRALVWVSKESVRYFMWPRGCLALRGRTWWPYGPLDIATS